MLDLRNVPFSQETCLKHPVLEVSYTFLFKVLKFFKDCKVSLHTDPDIINRAKVVLLRNSHATNV